MPHLSLSSFKKDMAATSFVFQVNCSTQSSSISQRFDHIKKSLSSYLSQPLLKRLHQLSLQIDLPKTMKNTSVKLLDAFVDLVFEFADQPLPPSQSNFAPIEEMGEVVNISSIEGTIPDDFPDGVYIRNGPNPLFQGLKSTKSAFGRTNSIWVEGEGMLHALYFNKDSGGLWTVSYNNKHVQTETYKLERERNKPCFIPAVEGASLAVLSAILLNLLRFGKGYKDLSNTNVFEHSGKFYSVAENYIPQEINILTLETLGDWDINGSWHRPFTGHPKRVPGTGELVTIGFDFKRPYLVLGVISADGSKLVNRVDLKLKRCTFSHDVGVTQRYSVILDFPLTIDIYRLIWGGPLIKFDSKDYARIGVMPHYADANSVKWFEVEPCCVFHILNCFEDGDEVVIWACRNCQSVIPMPKFGSKKKDSASRGFEHATSVEENSATAVEDELMSRAYEWRLNMQSGEVKEKYLTETDFSMDFPMINENLVGVKNKFGYTQVVDSTASYAAAIGKFGGLAKLHLHESEIGISSGVKQSELEELIKVEYHMLPKNTFCSGAAFVPKVGGCEEDDGWIITFVHNENTSVSQVYVVDTKKFSSKPVAKITLPTRVPYGFHGAFFPISSGFIKQE